MHKGTTTESLSIYTYILTESLPLTFQPAPPTTLPQEGILKTN